MKLFVERPIATVVLLISLMVLGIYSFINVPIELAPKAEYPQMQITAAWSGLPPEIMLTQVTIPLEERAAGIKGVIKISSSSGIGMSSITLDFDPKINMEFASLALREKMGEVKDSLPREVTLNLSTYVPPQFQVNPFLSYNISADYSIDTLREVVKDKIEIGLGSIQGVSSVAVTGGADPVIRILLDDKKIKALDIHPYLISSQIINRSRLFETGVVKKGEQEYIFKVTDPIIDLRDLKESTVAYRGNNPIRLKDVAKVEQTYGDLNYIHRINGQPTINLTVRKEPGSSTPKVAKAAKEKLESLKKELPKDLVFRTIDDESADIQNSLNELYLLVGIIITVIFALIFISLRSFKPSLLVLSSIFFSVCITFILIYAFKISINMLTLGGLTLGFGLFVDNAIVVFENVLRLREKGYSPINAAIQGPKEVFLPVLAGTLTTVCVFFSFAYFQGRLKMYYLPVAIVMVIALMTSLFVSFSLIPALSPKLLKKVRKAPKEKLRNVYEKFLGFAIRHPLEILLIIAVIFFLSYKWFKSEVSTNEFFNWNPQQALSVSISMPQGTPIEVYDEVISQFEDKVLENSYEKEMNTSVSSGRASLRIQFPPEIEYSYRPYLLKEELIQLATNFAGLNISIGGFDPQGYYSSVGGSVYLGSRIIFFGYNLKKLKDIAKELEITLKQNPRIREVRGSPSRYGYSSQDSFEFVLKIDRALISKFDIDPQYLISYISTLLSGTRISQRPIKVGGVERFISIKFPEAALMDVKTLQDTLIQTQTGKYFRLGEITSLEEKTIAGSIDREDQQYRFTVSWEFRGPYKAANKYEETIYNNLELPPGFTAILEDTGRFMTQEEKGQITVAIILSLVIIFMILASLYESLIQPFFILFAVPLALIGVFVAFVLANFPFDASAYIGVILLGGIVVNNSILLVDHINLKRKQDLPFLEAVLKGSRERIRPILMTTSTTVLGMLPLVLIQMEVGRRKIWSTLALTTVGGLVSSTIFILIAIPILYYHGDRIHLWGNRKAEEIREAWRRYGT
ncbi:MAG: efflux RND transporter permease subunit [Candidatus Aminicenantes bacterium]|nr:efflux RND transporter permease subunit [Candidatus Aminicenantes bacterium]